MRQTGRTEVDVALLSYDERLTASAFRSEEERRLPRRARGEARDKAAREGRRFPMAGKTVDVRA